MLPYEPWLAERYVISAVLIVLICATADDSWAACRERPPTVRLLGYPSNECRYRPSRSRRHQSVALSNVLQSNEDHGSSVTYFCFKVPLQGRRNAFRCEYSR